MNMKRTWTRWALTAALSLGSAWGGLTAVADPTQPQATAKTLHRGAPAPQVATVDQLKSEAFKALRGGKFDRVNELLTRAASMATNDPVLKQMAAWTSEFEAQRQEFVAE